MGLFSRTAKVITDEKAINELLTRSVENVIPRELALKKLRSGESLRIYLGIDPTGGQLHLGHSVAMRKLRAFSDMGHQVVFLVGSFTAMIGDPSGRDTQREPLTPGQVEENFATYKRQAEKVLDFSKVEIRYNHEWLSSLSLKDIVKFASTFTVQQMFERDMFKRRMDEGKPVALHEFLYPLMVGYDSVALDVDAELGGSDQEFNMLAGRHLLQSLKKKEKFILTTRLIEGTDGRKMSKTYNNAVYLEDEPNDMYGKLMSVKDELIVAYFEDCTDVPKEEITEILKEHPKDAKMRLAKEIVTTYHNANAAVKAQENFVSTFSKGEVPTDIPTVSVAKGTLLRDALATLGESNSELRRLVEAGAITEVGGQTVRDLGRHVEHEMTLRIGKHRFLKITII
ncbi:tyrosine--tRNA ligase [Acetobacteraceae bacterium]|nr:tyrosine--tRNA ligase [Candidatus Parcubacteria bacterium]